jgi:hypothetical protein
MNVPTDFEQLKREITRDNARDLLRDVACPTCGAVGEFDLLDVHANNGVALQCAHCGRRHPFMGYGVQFLPISADARPRRSNDIAAVVDKCGGYCYGCGQTREELTRLGLTLSVHHTRPFAEHGEAYAKIPLCSFCHESVSGAQRAMARIMKMLGRNT